MEPPPPNPILSSFLLTKGLIVNGTIVHCKIVVFFLKISKEIGKAWHKNVRRLSPASLPVFSLVPDLLFDCSRVYEYAKIRTVLQSSTIEGRCKKKLDDVYSCCAILTAVYSGKL